MNYIGKLSLNYLWKTVHHTVCPTLFDKTGIICCYHHTQWQWNTTVSGHSTRNSFFLKVWIIRTLTFLQLTIIATEWFCKNCFGAKWTKLHAMLAVLVEKLNIVPNVFWYQCSNVLYWLNTHPIIDTFKRSRAVSLIHSRILKKSSCRHYTWYNFVLQKGQWIHREGSGLLHSEI